MEKEKWKYFDLQKGWNNYGKIYDIQNLSETQRNYKLSEFAEGSASLEKCLKLLWDKGIKTKACCKGNHISMNCDNKPRINCEAYISFSNSEWLKYLSKETIEREM